MTVALVHLVWPPLGTGQVERFLRSYKLHPPGGDHELVILINGTPTAEARDAMLASLRGVDHRLMETPRPLLDLPAYAFAAASLTHDRMCFANSYAEARQAGWLSILNDALDLPRVALAATTGSWESQAEWVRGRVRHWPLQLIRGPSARRDYPRFPNPHVRTSVFALERADALRLNLAQASTKRDTYLAESGRKSITRRLEASGQRAVVVGRDGNSYDSSRWPSSATYRCRQQRNLLVADNRTSDWQNASPRLRRRLSRDAWGDQAF